MIARICTRALACAALVVTPTVARAQAGDVVLHAGHATAHGNWIRVDDTTAAGGVRLANPNRNAAKLVTALATPEDYFELQFLAQAGVPYRLWMRGVAEANAYSNDSVHVQFSDSVTATGAARFRIGTTSSTVYTVEDCSGCGVAGWGWNDNFYGTAAGDAIYFAASGVHTIRVQVREDGLSLDQIVLSPATYRLAAPGAGKHDATTLAEAGLGPDPTATIVMHAAHATPVGRWQVVADSTAAGGTRLANPNRGAAKLMTALAAPQDYFELQFLASAGVPYRLWMRGLAEANSYANDSAHVQFSDSVTAAGTPAYRIGSTASTVYTVEDCSGCGVAGWGWNDNFYGATPGEAIYFATSGVHTIRVQVREDGLSLDQIVLSPVQYLTASPGTARNDVRMLGEFAVVAPYTTPDPLAGAQPPEPPSVSNLSPVFAAGTEGFRIASLHGSKAAPATLLFTASASGPEATDSLTYTWSFGDGSAPESYVQAAEASRQNAMHTYRQAGTYTATVSVADQAGNVVTRSGTVTVGPTAAIPAAPTLKVVQLNTYKGRSTETRVEQSKVWLQARWLAASGADVILLQEVMGTAHANKYKAELERLTGATWSYFYRSDNNTNSSSAQGLAIFTRKAILTTASMAYAPCPAARVPQRAAIAITVEANGRNIVVIDTHLSSYSGSADQACRSSQARQLSAWALNLGPNRIITGDLNADPAEDAIKWLVANGTSLYTDTWAAPAAGAPDRRLSYPDNPVGSLVTRSERIDYVLTAKGSLLDLVSIQVPDTRDFTNGGAVAAQAQTRWSFQNAAPRISDHEMLIATFVVR